MQSLETKSSRPKPKSFETETPENGSRDTSRDSIAGCQRYFRARTPNRAVPFDVLFLWQRYSLHKTVLISNRALHFHCALSVRAFFSLCTWRCWERWAAPGEDSWNGQIDEILFETLSKKWYEHWDHHHKFTVAHRLRQPMLLSGQYDLDLKPPSFIWRQGIHALQ